MPEYYFNIFFGEFFRRIFFFYALKYTGSELPEVYLQDWNGEGLRGLSYVVRGFGRFWSAARQFLSARIRGGMEGNLKENGW